MSDTGNHAGEAAFPIAATTESWFALARVDVAGAGVDTRDRRVRRLDHRRVPLDDRHQRPLAGLLARRLARGKPRLGDANAGIGGNRVLASAAQAGVNALARFDRDALASTGVTYVIVLEGINDIGKARDDPTPTAADVDCRARADDRTRAHARRDAYWRAR